MAPCACLSRDSPPLPETLPFTFRLLELINAKRLVKTCFRACEMWAWGTYVWAGSNAYSHRCDNDDNSSNSWEHRWEICEKVTMRNFVRYLHNGYVSDICWFEFALSSAPFPRCCSRSNALWYQKFQQQPRTTTSSTAKYILFFVRYIHHCSI